MVRNGTPVVDVHAHAIVEPAMALMAGQAEAQTAKRRELEIVGPASAHTQKEMIAKVAPLLTDVEQRLAAMDRAGVDIQLVSPSPAHYHDWPEPELATVHARMIATGLAELCATRPDRLLGLGLAPLQDPGVAEAVLVETMKDFGLRGVEISTNAPGRELGDPELEGFWARAEELGAVVFIHPWGCTLAERLSGHYLYNIVGNPVETTVALSHIIFSGLLDRHPDLKIIAAHGGGYLPMYPGRMDHAREVRPELDSPAGRPSDYLRRLYFDSLVHDPEQLSGLVDRVGADRILLGSDFPFDMGVPDPVERVEAVPGLDEEERCAICGGNAVSLLGISRTRPGRGQ
ncbi:MAG: amidohydrolase family protein [Solirubrobacterales bacterium]